MDALVTSWLDFNNALLFGLPASLLDRLQLAQNAAAKVIMCAKKYDHVTPILHDLHWLPVRQRIVYKMLLIVFKIVHKLDAPEYLASLLSPHAPARALRSSDITAHLSVPRAKKAVGERAFSRAAPRLWNSLNGSLRQEQSITAFKKALKTQLFV